ncbi:MAG TPA: hypothetical protein VNK41_02610 [Vicinamibacterales bacterium]|nr:hypothetical protein [Vicinamibacterales bacterium]
MDYRETGGADQLDVNLRAAAAPARLRAIDFLHRTRVALGLQPVTAPAVVFVPLGFVLGPQVLNVLTRSALGHLDPAVIVALAALGIFIGMGIEAADRESRRLLAASSIQAFLTIAAVGLTSLWLMSQWGMRVDLAAGIVAAVLGVAGSVSSASAPDRLGERHRLITRIADFDDFVAVVTGAVVVAAIGAADAQQWIVRLAEVVTVGLLVGVAGWLLFERAHSVAERGVFVIGALALVGGAAVSVNGSPLLAGMVAGVCWKRLPGRADLIVRSDVSRFQHPLVILLLVVAGAYIELTPLAIWLLAPFVVFRLAGKVIGAWAASRLVPTLRPGDLAACLLAPGLLGIGLVLNFVQMSSTEAATAVASAVAIGTLASEVLALIAAPGQAREQ